MKMIMATIRNIIRHIIKQTQLIKSALAIALNHESILYTFLKAKVKYVHDPIDEITSNGTDMVMMTHDQIARHLGTAREVITRLLKHFAADGWIEVSRKGIKILQKEKLRDNTRQ